MFKNITISETVYTLAVLKPEYMCMRQKQTRSIKFKGEEIQKSQIIVGLRGS